MVTNNNKQTFLKITFMQAIEPKVVISIKISNVNSSWLVLHVACPCSLNNLYAYIGICFLLGFRQFQVIFKDIYQFWSSIVRGWVGEWVGGWAKGVT